MIDLVKMLILAFVQGISEWFPISSSGHLVLFSDLLGFNGGIQFDVALHFGTLMAVFVYFGKDIVDVVEALLKGELKNENAKLGFLLIVATIPAAVIGFVFKKLFEDAFNSLLIVGICFAITSLVLFIASFYSSGNKQTPSYKDAWIIGFVQALAILPGISRSGSTISAGVFRKIDLKKAMRFSFLMAIPAIFGASILELGTGTLPSSYAVPTLLTFAVGLATIHILLKVVGNSRKNLMWFAVYELLIALVTIIYALVH